LKNNPRLSFQKGFTLLEVLISLALLSLIATAIITISKQTVTARDEVTREDSDALKIYNALQIMQWDIAHFYTPLSFSKRLILTDFTPTLDAPDSYKQLYQQVEQWVNTHFRGNKRFVGVTTNGSLIPKVLLDGNSEITFLTNGHRRKNKNEFASNFKWITYKLSPAKDDEIEEAKRNYETLGGTENFVPGQNLVRSANAKNPFEAEVKQEDLTPEQILLDGVTEITWSFWDKKKKQFSELASYTEENAPLIALKVLIKYRDTMNVPMEKEKIFLTSFNQQYAVPLTTATPIASPSNNFGEGGVLPNGDGANGNGGDGGE